MRFQILAVAADVGSFVRVVTENALEHREGGDAPAANLRNQLFGLAAMTMPREGARLVGDRITVLESAIEDLEVAAAFGASAGVELGQEQSDSIEHAATKRHVGPAAEHSCAQHLPRHAARIVLPRRREAPAKATVLFEVCLRGCFELVGGNQAGNGADRRVASERLLHRACPTGIDHNVIIDERDDVTPRIQDAAISRPIEARTWLAAIADVRKLSDDLPGFTADRSVIDDDDLERLGLTGAQGAKAPPEIFGPASRADHHRHVWQSLSSAAFRLRLLVDHFFAGSQTSLQGVGQRPPGHDLQVTVEHALHHGSEVQAGADD